MVRRLPTRVKRLDVATLRDARFCVTQDTLDNLLVRSEVAPFSFCRIANYCWKTGEAPLTRFHFRETLTSTRLATLMKGMLLFMP